MSRLIFECLQFAALLLAVGIGSAQSKADHWFPRERLTHRTIVTGCLLVIVGLLAFLQKELCQTARVATFHGFHFLAFAIPLSFSASALVAIGKIIVWAASC